MPTTDEEEHVCHFSRLRLVDKIGGYLDKSETVGARTLQSAGGGQP
jgi:hypothetical protein